MAIDGISGYAWGVPTKTYGQMCPLARSLDVLGERWTMLVIRELLLGPKRFKHLLAVLPAIGSNRLSERLRGLEEAGIIRKSTLPPPAGVPVYELTEEGERLRDPLIALGLWGLALPIDDRIDPATARAELIALCLAGTQTKLLDPSRGETFEFHVGDEVFHFQLHHGRFLPRSGPSPTITSTPGNSRRTRANTRTTSRTRFTARKFETWMRIRRPSPISRRSVCE